MVQRRQRFRFALEPREPLGIRREYLRQDLDRDLAVEPGVTGAVDLAHPTGTEQREDFVRAEATARFERHEDLWSGPIMPYFSRIKAALQVPTVIEFQLAPPSSKRPLTPSGPLLK
jgi:hypothetical protein